MDIVVTIPKTEYKNNKQEREYQIKNKEAFGFRVFKNKPKKLDIGDRIYFVKDGGVKYSKEIFNIIDKKQNKFDFDMVCDITGRKYDGDYVIFFNKERNEEVKNIKVNGFQGFRYKWW